MTASPRRRSLLGRSGAARRASDRRSVTAPLRIGKDTKLTIEELEALAIEDFPDEDDEDYDDAPFEDEGDLGLELGEDTVRSDVEEEATGTVWTKARGGADPALPIGLPTAGPPVALDVIERGVAGSGYIGADTADSFAIDDPPSEEVRKDPRFQGLDFTGGAEPPLADTVRMDRALLAAAGPARPPSEAAAPEPLRLYGMVAALLGSGSVAVIVVCVLLGTVAIGSLLLANGTGDGTEDVPATVIDPEPVPLAEEPIADEPGATEPGATEPADGEPATGTADGDGEEPVASGPARRRPRTAPVEVEAPEPVVDPEPPPAPVPQPPVVEDPTEDDKRGLFGKKKKK